MPSRDSPCAGHGGPGPDLREQQRRKGRHITRSERAGAGATSLVWESVWRVGDSTIILGLFLFKTEFYPISPSSLSYAVVVVKMGCSHQYMC